MRNFVVRCLKTALFRSPLRDLMIFKYKFMFSPSQLAFLCARLDETAGVEGDIMEIGCASGHTTVYLNEHLNALKSPKRYLCLDTFSGFTDRDVEFERGNRGKKSPYDGFRANSRTWFEHTLRANGIQRAVVHQRDVLEFDFTLLGPISFCLLDVDLYLPTARALEGTWTRLSPGGVIVVDDCVDGTAFDGAYQAYVEFTERRGLLRDLCLGKLGVLRRPGGPGFSVQ